MTSVWKTILAELVHFLGSDLVHTIGLHHVEEVAKIIADYKSRYENETDIVERQRLEDDIAFLEANLMMTLERKRLQLAKHAEVALKKSVQLVLKSQFPLVSL